MKFKFISHRGNLAGPMPEFENRPDYIDNALDLGFDVEVDLWSYDNKFFLGHDEGGDSNDENGLALFLSRIRSGNLDQPWVCLGLSRKTAHPRLNRSFAGGSSRSNRFMSWNMFGSYSRIQIKKRKK